MNGHSGAARIGMSGRAGRLLIDVGTSTITGVTATAAPGLARRARYLGHPTMRTIALDGATVAALGSDLTRIGYAFEPPAPRDGFFLDPLGVTWSSDGSSAAPLEHPLAGDPRPRVSGRPMPVWPDLVQVPDGWPALGLDPGDQSASITILDAPCPGLLETGLALRGSWAFLEDLADQWRSATALLEWALEMNVAAYEQALAALPAPPDVVLLGDDYGQSRAMFISDADFRAHLHPRLRTLVARLRRLTPAAICFHSCGAIGPILGDLADLEFEILDLDADADGMDIAKVRRALPSATVLHGWADLEGLGQACAVGNRTAVRRLVADLALSGPAIAAPADAVTTPAALNAVVLGAALVSALSDWGIEWPRIGGPDAVPEDALDHAEEVARTITVPVNCGEVPRTLSRAAMAARRGEPGPHRRPEAVLA